MHKKQRFEHHLEAVKGSEVRAGRMENPQDLGLQLTKLKILGTRSTVCCTCYTLVS